MATSKKEKSIIIHEDQMKALSTLNNEQKGEIMNAIFSYMAENDYSFSDPVCEIAFQFIKVRFDRDKELYEEKCNKNRENGRNSLKNKKEANATERPQSPPNAPLSDTDTDILNPLTPFEGGTDGGEKKASEGELKTTKRKGRPVDIVNGMTKKRLKTVPYSEDFEAVWQAFPQRGRTEKREAFWAYWCAMTAPTFPGKEVLIQRIQNCEQSDQWKRGYCKHITAWLNAQAWDDPMALQPETVRPSNPFGKFAG